MQLSRFTDGGFVLHKVVTHLNHRSHCSAWFNKDGAILDAELIFRDGRTRQVRRGGAIWRELRSIGGAYSQTLDPVA